MTPAFSIEDTTSKGTHLTLGYWLRHSALTVVFAGIVWWILGACSEVMANGMSVGGVVGGALLGQWSLLAMQSRGQPINKGSLPARLVKCAICGAACAIGSVAGALVVGIWRTWSI